MGYVNWPHGITGDILSNVYDERLRQEQLKYEGKFAYSCSDSEITHTECFLVLAEEFGEVAHEVNEAIGGKVLLRLEDLEKELVQVAAVAVAWAEKVRKEREALVSTWAEKVRKLQR